MSRGRSRYQWPATALGLPDSNHMARLKRNKDRTRTPISDAIRIAVEHYLDAAEEAAAYEALRVAESGETCTNAGNVRHVKHVGHARHVRRADCEPEPRGA